LILVSTASVLGCGGDGFDTRIPETVRVTPGAVTFSSIGDSLAFSATILDEAGSTINTTVTWSSSDPLVATVSNSGLVTSVGNGSATITATANTVPGTADVSVQQVVASVGVLPPSLSLMATLTDRIIVTPADANGNAVSGVTVAWASDNPATATVDPATGDITGVATGTATITATAGPFSGEAQLSVIPFAAATFSEAVEPIFTATCASVRCHSGPSRQRGLDLSAGNAYANMVAVASTDVPGLNQITPNDPLQSYIIHKLRGTHLSVGGVGEQMPRGEAGTNDDIPTLAVVSNDEIAAIVAWILSGAANN
jgi:hypothetical protein